MRTGVVIGGIALILIGIALAVSAAQTEGGSWAVLFLLLGIGMIILGPILMIAGLAAYRGEGKDKQPIVLQVQNPQNAPISAAPFSVQPQGELTTVLAICPMCKNRIPAGLKFCSECGADLRPREPRLKR